MKPNDKNKVAQVLAGMLGVDKAESMSPDQAVNTGLRSIKNKRMTPELSSIIKKMLKLADEVGIKVDKSLVPHSLQEVAGDSPITGLGSNVEQRSTGVISFKNYIKKKPASQFDHIDDQEQTETGSKLHPEDDEEDDQMRRRKVEYKISEEKDHDEELDDEELEDIVDDVDDEEDILDAYDHDEIDIIDDETGEVVDDEPLDEAVLLEVLSRAERIRARLRLLRTQAKRNRKLKIALHKKSDNKTIKKRARRLAVALLKKRIMKKSPGQLTIAEKERVEAIIKKRKKTIDRLAMRLMSKIRKIEDQRLSHPKATKNE